MTLYTIIPEEEIFRTGSEQAEQRPIELREMNWEGRLLLVERINDSQVRVERILQPCGLQDFLDPAFQPGAIIQFNVFF